MSWVDVLARIRTRSVSGAMVTVMMSLMVLVARHVEGLHLGAARVSEHANGALRGQLPGTVIRHAARTPGTAIALAVAVIKAPLIARAVTFPSCTGRVSPARSPAVVGAVHVSPIAAAADGEKRLAARTGRKSVIGHVLARADFLPWLSCRARLRASTRPRSTLKAGSFYLLAFVLSGVRSCRTRPAQTHEVSGARSSGRRSRGTEWPITPVGAVDGDVVIVGLFTDRASTTVTTPTDFEKIADLSTFDDIHGWFYVHTIGLTEPIATTFTFTATSYASAIGVAYRNVRRLNPVDTAAYGGSAANPLAAPSVTTTVADEMLVAIYLANDTVSAVWVGPSDMTARGQTGIAAAFDSPFGAAGVTGARLATNDHNVSAVNALIGLAPKE